MPSYGKTAANGLNVLETMYGQGFGRGSTAYDQSFAVLNDLLYGGRAQPLLDQIGNIPGLFSGTGLTPDMTNLLGSMGPLNDLYQQVLQGGGPGSSLLDALQQIAGGQSPQFQSAMGNIQGTLNDWGSNGNLQNMQSVANYILNNPTKGTQIDSAVTNAFGLMQNGGMNPALQNLISQGQGLFSSGGFTPQMGQLMDLAQGGIQAGGMTPELGSIFNSAQGLFQNGGQGGALIPMQQAVSDAIDAAGTAIQQQSQQALRAALARGGGAGAVVGSGLQNQGLAEFADQAARAQAEAARNARATQQGLQLQQELGAFSAANQAMNTAAMRTGVFGSMANSLANAAASNMGTGAGLMQAGNQLANARMGMGLEGFQGLQGLINARQQMAGNLGLGVQSQQAQNMFNAMSQLQGLQGLQANAANIGMNALNNRMNIAGNLLGQNQRTAADVLLGAQGQNIQRGYETGNLQNQALNNWINTILGATGQMNQQGQGFFDLSRGSMPGIGNLFDQWTQLAGSGNRFLNSFLGGFGKSSGTGLVGGIGAVLGGLL
jgi:hypothetical protein